VTGLRIAYMAGPGNVLGAYECLERGERDTTNSHVGYSELMLHACMSVGASELLALTTHPSGGYEREDLKIDGLRVIVERIHDDFAGKSGLGYHAASFAHARTVRRALDRFKPDVLVVSDDPPRAGALRRMTPPGCKLVRVFHCAVTPTRRDRTLRERLLLGLDVMTAPRFDAILTASRQVSDQVRELWPDAPIAEFLPHFDRELHLRIQPLPAFDRELRCVFVGRVERAKGVFDLLEAAKLLKQMRAPVSFDVCGHGSAFQELENQAVAAHQAGQIDIANFRLRGWCNREVMQSVTAQAHVGVVPTRTEFGEGFNQAAVELLLSGRPIVTSHAIPAAKYVKDAASIVPPDNPGALALELAYLASQKGFGMVAHMHEACERATAKFLRPETSYQTAMEHVIGALARGQRVIDRRVGFDGEVGA
jgi:glycogen(starch) synthase